MPRFHQHTQLESPPPLTHSEREVNHSAHDRTWAYKPRGRAASRWSSPGVREVSTSSLGGTIENGSIFLFWPGRVPLHSSRSKKTKKRTCGEKKGKRVRLDALISLGPNKQNNRGHRRCTQKYQVRTKPPPLLRGGQKGTRDSTPKFVAHV